MSLAAPRSRTLIPLLVAVLGVALGVGGIALLLRPFTPGVPAATGRHRRHARRAGSAATAVGRGHPRPDRAERGRRHGHADLRRRDRLGNRLRRSTPHRAHPHQQSRDQGRDLGHGHRPGDRPDLPGAHRRRGRGRRHRRPPDQAGSRAPRRSPRRLGHGQPRARRSCPSATRPARAARPRSRPASSAAPAGRSRPTTAPPGSARRCTACWPRPPGSSPATRAARSPTRRER